MLSVSFASLPMINNKADPMPCLGIGNRCRGEMAYAGMEGWRETIEN